MPFLDWLKRKPENTKARVEPVIGEKLAIVPTNTLETIATRSEQETGPATNEPVSTDLEASPQTVPVDSEPATSETDQTPAMPHLSVAIGAFYSKLPAHLLAPKIPDLARFVQIAEGDVVLDEVTREATLPLSILSLSCPEIFIRAVDSSEDIPITFFIDHAKEVEPPATEPSNRPEEPEPSLPRSEDALVTNAGGVGENEIKLRLQPILIDFPPQLEPPEIHSLFGTEAEIALPLDLIQSQLANGRVVVPAALFCKALPSDLRHYFESVDPAAEIPIPLQEVFSRLAPSAIKLRDDQETDQPEETIPTPFAEHADEDAKRFAQQVPVEAAAAANEAPQPNGEPFRIGVESDPERLQAIFLTDEPLDLAKAIQNVAALPGLKSCLLSTSEGVKLAGHLDDPGQEKAISKMLPELFEWTDSKLAALQAGRLETITFYYSRRQLSAFVHGKLCLTVLHDNRPFKPGVREKIQAVMNELAALSASEKPV